MIKILLLKVLSVGLPSIHHHYSKAKWSLANRIKVNLPKIYKILLHVGLDIAHTDGTLLTNQGPSYKNQSPTYQEQSLTSSSEPASLDAHGNTKRQRSCSHYTAICNQRVKKRKELRTHQHPLVAEQRRNRFAPGSSAAAPAAHTKYTFHRRPERLYTEKRKVSCPGFPPKRSPCNIHAAITMRFETSSSQPASLDAHGNTKRQRSCSHYTAICNHRVKKRKELRTHEHSLQNTEEEPIRARFERSRTRRTHEVPFIAGRSHFTRRIARFPAPAFPQNEAHVTSMQP